MAGGSVRQQPSETALFTALRRCLANRAYGTGVWGSDNLAEIFLPPRQRFLLRFAFLRRLGMRNLARFMPGLTEYVIARTAFFDALFRGALEDRIPQIVVLGAGYDSRAFRFAALNRGTAIFDLDAAPTQNRKIGCLKDARISLPDEVRFVAADLEAEPPADALGRAGYDPAGRTLFLWEGVSYYLDRDSVKGTLAFFGRCAGGTVAAFDYCIPLTGEAAKGRYGAEEFLVAMRTRHANEKLLFTVDPGGVPALLAEQGLQLRQHLDAAAIEAKYLHKPDGTLIGRMTGIFGFVAASPRDGARAGAFQRPSASPFHGE
jgi:methyltransferase (TIGR00027 family)